MKKQSPTYLDPNCKGHPQRDDGGTSYCFKGRSCSEPLAAIARVIRDLRQMREIHSNCPQRGCGLLTDIKEYVEELEGAP